MQITAGLRCSVYHRYIMSAPHQRSGGENAFTTTQEAALSLIHDRVISGLGERMLEEVHGFATRRLEGGLVTLPALALCSLMLYRNFGPSREESGGLQFGFEMSDPLFGTHASAVRVPLYRATPLVEPLDPLETDQAEQVARAVEEVRLFCDLEGLEIDRDLTRILGTDVPIIAYAQYQNS
jgi:hypothetical protein